MGETQRKKRYKSGIGGRNLDKTKGCVVDKWQKREKERIKQDRTKNTAGMISNKGCILIKLIGFAHHDIIQKLKISLWAIKSVIISANTVDSKAII